MIRRPPRSTRTDTLFPYTTLFRSAGSRALTEAIYGKLDNNGHISRRPVAQLYDPVRGMFLPDRYVKGICPNCGTPDQYGDNCAHCGPTYSPTELTSPYSVARGATPELPEPEDFFFRQSEGRWGWK